MTTPLPGQTHYEILYEQGSPARPNEDSYLVWQDDTQLVLGVMDGVTQMLDFPSLAQVTRLGGRPVTPGRFAAYVTRNVVAQSLSVAATLPLETVLTRANDAIRDAVAAVYGAMSVAAIVAREPQFAHLAAEERFVRPLLPATVVTLARVDLATRRLTCAHVGDSALFLFHADGSVTHLTRDTTVRANAADPTLTAAKNTRLDHTHFHASLAAIDLDMLIGDNGGRFHHNYVDPNGEPRLGMGMGVLDGLPAMTAYLRSYSTSLEEVTAVLVCSDGFIWPLAAGETAASRDLLLRDYLARLGLPGYLAALREREAAGQGLAPRWKIHDDATAIYLRLATPA